MPDSKGNFKLSIAVPDLPWKRREFVQSALNDPDVVWVDQSGQYVNSDGEPLSEQDFDLTQEDYDSHPKGV